MYSKPLQFSSVAPIDPWIFSEAQGSGTELLEGLGEAPRGCSWPMGMEILWFLRVQNGFCCTTWTKGNLYTFGRCQKTSLLTFEEIGKGWERFPLDFPLSYMVNANTKREVTHVAMMTKWLCQWNIDWVDRKLLVCNGKIWYSVGIRGIACSDKPKHCKQTICVLFTSQHVHQSIYMFFDVKTENTGESSLIPWPDEGCYRLATAKMWWLDHEHKS